MNGLKKGILLPNTIGKRGIEALPLLKFGIPKMGFGW
jgi:hypothetical protein